VAARFPAQNRTNVRKIKLDLLERIHYNLFVERKKRGDILSPRTGRPKLENPKNHDIKVRIDEKTNNSIIDYAKRHNISRTEAIRRGMELLLTTEK